MMTDISNYQVKKHLFDIWSLIYNKAKVLTPASQSKIIWLNKLGKHLETC